MSEKQVTVSVAYDPDCFDAANGRLVWQAILLVGDTVTRWEGRDNLDPFLALKRLSDKVNDPELGIWQNFKEAANAAIEAEWRNLNARHRAERKRLRERQGTGRES